MGRDWHRVEFHREEQVEKILKFFYRRRAIVRRHLLTRGLALQLIATHCNTQCFIQGPGFKRWYESWHNGQEIVSLPWHVSAPTTHWNSLRLQNTTTPKLPAINRNTVLFWCNFHLRVLRYNKKRMYVRACPCACVHVCAVSTTGTPLKIGPVP